MGSFNPGTSSSSSGTSTVSYVSATTDVSTSDATSGASTGISTSVVAGKEYYFTFVLRVSSPNSTVGVRFALMESNSAASTNCTLASLTNRVGGDVQSGYATSANAWTSEGGGSNGEIVLATIRVLYVCSTSGTVALWFKPETAGVSVSMYQDSWLLIDTLN